MKVDTGWGVVEAAGNWLLVQKCRNPDVKDDTGRVLVVLPDKTAENTNFAAVLSVGAGCKDFSENEVGTTVLIPELFDTNMHMVDADQHIVAVRETVVLPAVWED